MLKALEILCQLQGLDTQIDTERERIATIDAILHDRSEYETTRQRHLASAEPVRRLDADQRDLELKIGSARNQLAEADQKLYSGRVGSPRELDDLQKRGADLRRQITAGEDSLLQVMEQLEAARSDATSAEGELRRVANERRALEAELLAERKALIASVRAATAERDQARTEADAQNLRTYDRLRVRHGGSAVAAVKQRTCLGCRVSLTAAYEQRLRQGETLVVCQSCGRFLHLDS